MKTSVAFARTLTRLDHVRLSRRIASGQVSPEAAERLEELLATSDVVDSQRVPPDVVTLYSQVLLETGDGVPQKIAVCYPEHADPQEGFVSVFSPVGMALLGLSVGQVARWEVPSGSEGRAVVAAVLFQPEATGDYTT